ncbi:MAG: maleylacetoacetate isomerase [Parvularcula sp.]
MKLIGYWRSGTTYRVRLALGAKGLDVEYTAVDLRKGEHRKDDYRQKNPSASVPLLQLDDGTMIAQSSAIVEYLDERYPTPPLLPASAKERSRVRHLSFIVGCDIHPLQNLRVQQYLRNELDLPETEVERWLQKFIGDGLAAFDAELSRDPSRGSFCHGGQFSMAECHLLPQLYAARRFGLPVDHLENILAVEEACAALPFVAAAIPEAQSDAPK